MDTQLSTVTNETVADAWLELGATLGPYRLEGVLGVGAMGRVYLGCHQRLGRQVALKVLHAKHTQDLSQLRRFLQEARLVNQINHEHIVEVYDFIELLEPHRVYCVMELLNGQSLAARIDEQALTLEAVVNVGRQIATALGAAHAVGVVHRDLKPDNVFLVQRDGSDDYVKVLDFGVAKLLTTADHSSATETQLGTVIGTPRYMAPEQVAALEVDHRADIYALGTVLYELLCGKTPFEMRSFGQLAADLIHQPPPPLPERTRRGELIPLSLRELIFSCLAKHPSARPATMASVVTWLTMAVEPTLSDAREVEPTKAARPKWVMPATIAVSLVLLGAGAWRLGGRSEASPVAAKAKQIAPAVIRVPDPATRVSDPATRAFVLSATSVPSGATVTRRDTREVIGTTPLELWSNGSRAPLVLEFELDGHPPVVRELTLDRDLHLEVLLPGPATARDAKPAKKKD